MVSYWCSFHYFMIYYYQAIQSTIGQRWFLNNRISNTVDLHCIWTLVLRFISSILIHHKIFVWLYLDRKHWYFPSPKPKSCRLQSPHIIKPIYRVEHSHTIRELMQVKLPTTRCSTVYTGFMICGDWSLHDLGLGLVKSQCFLSRSNQIKILWWMGIDEMNLKPSVQIQCRSTVLLIWLFKNHLCPITDWMAW